MVISHPLLQQVADDYRLSNEKRAAVKALIDASENVVIAFGMGWDMADVVATLGEVVHAGGHSAVAGVDDHFTGKEVTY